MQRDAAQKIRKIAPKHHCGTSTTQGCPSTLPRIGGWAAAGRCCCSLIVRPRSIFVFIEAVITAVIAPKNNRPPLDHTCMVQPLVFFRPDAICPLCNAERSRCSCSRNPEARAHGERFLTPSIQRFSICWTPRASTPQHHQLTSTTLCTVGKTDSSRTIFTAAGEHDDQSHAKRSTPTGPPRLVLFTTCLVGLYIS